MKIVNEAIEERLENEDKIRAPLIKLITDAVPVFREDDFQSWTTQHLEDLAGRVRRYKVKAGVDAAYEEVGV